MTGFQRLCVYTCVLVFGLIVLGGIVRHTDSGLGCGDDWPRCEGSFIPRLEADLLIEYSHRLVASIAGLLVLGVMVLAFKNYRRVPAIIYPSIATFVLILFQGGLGAITVRTELASEIVMVHLGTALVIMALLMLIAATVAVLNRPRSQPATDPMIGMLAAFALVWTFALMLVGSFVSGAGYSLACSGWPLCNGEIVPTVNSASVQIIFLHRVLALTAGLLVLALTWFTFTNRAKDPFSAVIAGFALAAFAAEGLVGAANVWTQIADPVAATHLGLGALIWVLLAGLNIHLHRLYDVLPHAAPSQRPNDLAEAAH